MNIEKLNCTPAKPTCAMAQTIKKVNEVIDYTESVKFDAARAETMQGYNVYDISLQEGINARKNHQSELITFTWDDENPNLCHVSGSTSSTASNNVIVSLDTLPDPIKAGEKYYLFFKSTDPNIKARIYQYNAAGNTLNDFAGSSIVSIKNDTTGIIVRINIAGGLTVNGDVEIGFLNGVPCNEYLDSALLTATGGTDFRHEEIEIMLQENGVCRLGPGDFYVGPIDMPPGSSIIGCGSATRLHFVETMQDGTPVTGNAITMASDCTVKDLQLIGSGSDIAPAANIGNRHGIMWRGNKSGAGNNIPVRGIISGVTISNFNGGGISFNDTGYGVDASCRVSNCIIYKCGAGINIPYWAEFNTFTNVSCTDCYYGVINNGGNNCFANCGINSNIIGFLIDNENDKSPNSAHGSMAGCTLNHNDDAAVKIIRTYNGYVFSGIQVFDGAVIVTDSMGVVFSGCEFGKDIPVTITGGQLTLFNGCMFTNAPALTVTNNSASKMVNCFDRFGAAVSIS